ncbi:MAG TPA: hypothetical protein DEO84_05520 [candidate division Zixibacteria bacterium]|nr:hypothetical protein [candidate division Zixibacteria bacterium]
MFRYRLKWNLVVITVFSTSLIGSVAVGQNPLNLPMVDNNHIGYVNYKAYEAITVNITADGNSQYRRQFQNIIIRDPYQDYNKRSLITRALLRLEESRVNPLTYNSWYASFCLDNLDYGDDNRGLTTACLGIKLKTDSNIKPFFQLKYESEKTRGNIHRFMFYYEGFFHEYYYYPALRNNFKDFYTFSIGWAF